MTSTYLRIPDISIKPAADAMPASLPFSFPLDPFQEHAVAAIHQGHNVLVCAKTGSGKTLVGEYQIEHTLAKGGRIFYTTPIKSLSNQKFHDLKGAYGARASVGILTGDIKFCPDADIIVMTTEILRNLLYKKGTATEHLGLTASLSLDRLDAVIFDECHYINDRDRGKVWEETMILLPRDVRLVMLSATLDHPELFAAWLGDLKEIPIHLIQTNYRIVPLTHTVVGRHADGQIKLIPTMDAAETYYDKAYSDWLRERDSRLKAADDYKSLVKSTKAGGDHVGGVAGKVRPASFIHQMNELVDYLASKESLPAIFFVLSRKACETYAEKVAATLLTSSETAALNHIISFHLHTYKELDTLPQYHHIRDLLLRGIAFHHSGLLPVLKEIVELAFSKGFVKVLFATETFAVGLNMPTKTVIFTGMSKYDSASEGMRLLRPDEYTQMAGRAGRRGKDKTGLVIYLPDREPLDAAEMKAVMRGQRQPVESRMDFHYDFILKTLQCGSVKWLEIMERSYWFRQRQQQLASCRADIVTNSKAIADLAITSAEAAAAAAVEQLEETINNSTNSKRKAAQRALAAWKEEHSGTRWANVRRLYTRYKALNAAISAREEDIAILEAHEAGIEPAVRFLRQIDFLKADATTTKDLGAGNLTVRGILATEVNEGNPILMTELFLSEKAHALSGEELVQVLAAFLELDEKKSKQAVNASSAVKDAISWLESVASELEAHEPDGVSPRTYWQLSTEWIEPVGRWLAGEHISTICADAGIFEGNFTRGILKLGNLLDEWLALATYCQHTSQIEKVGTIRPLLIRDVVIPDSIYLKL
jgi:superfamily II RNA helicase